MERIQSAIAKARAQREAAQPGATAPAPDVPPTPAVPADVAGRWQALTPIQIEARQMERNRIIAFGGGRESVPVDVMRTRLLQQMRAKGWRRLAITSPSAACGKSMLALNLAFSLARQPTTRTILCEADLRRPSLSQTLGLRETLAFAKVLAGEADFADHARRHGDNLAFALNRHAWRNPAELLHGPQVAGALARIEEEYDPQVMIFDMPPMLVSDDAMAFMEHVDCVLLVAAAEATTISQIDSCERELAQQTNVMGVVLNKCRYLERDRANDYY